MAAGLADVEQRKEVRRLARRGQHGSRTALKLGNLCGDVVVRGVLQARVEVARRLEVKELAHVLARVVLERGGLHDRNLARLAVAGGVPALDTYGVDALVAHGVLSCANAGPAASQVSYVKQWRQYRATPGSKRAGTGSVTTRHLRCRDTASRSRRNRRARTAPVVPRHPRQQNAATPLSAELMPESGAGHSSYSCGTSRARMARSHTCA